MSVLRGYNQQLMAVNLYDLFSDLLEKGHAKDTAIIHNHQKYTYNDLRRKSSDIAMMLLDIFQKYEVKESQVVALLVPPSMERISSLLALLKIGCAYLPLDPVLSLTRMQTIVQEADVQFLLTTKDQLQFCNQLGDNLIALDVSDTSIMRGNPGVRYDIPSNPLVCVLFTSGSTGKPKGVKLDVRNVLNRLLWYWEEFPFTESDVACHKTNLLFVDSLTEILGALLKGVPLVILDQEVTKDVERLTEELQRSSVTRIVVVPSLLSALLSLNMPLSTLKLLVCSGEALHPDIARQAMEVLPDNCALCNFYGSTETTGDATYLTLKDISSIREFTSRGSLSVGRPIANTCVKILGKGLELVAEGEIGEIYISGVCITPGYINDSSDSELINLDDGETLYRTRDVGFVKDGLLYYTGRNDCQIKVRGHRVDLHEIQRAVEEVEAIEKVVMIPCCDKSICTTVPVAFCKLKGGTNIPAEHMEETIKEHCRIALTEYMVPSIIFTKRIPLQKHTGKIDRQALTKMFDDVHTTSSQSGDSCPLEIIANALGITAEKLEQGGNFFSLGGNSLSAVVAVANLRKNGIFVNLNDFVQVNDIRRFLEPQAIYTDCADVIENYQIQIISQEMKHIVPEFLAREFIGRNPLHVIAGTTEERLKTQVESVFSNIVDDELSFVLWNGITNSIDACTLLLDAATKTKPTYAREEVSAVVAAVGNPVRSRLLESGNKWIYGSFVAVRDDLPHSSKLLLLTRMEDFVLDLARRRRYNGIITVNVHPVIMVLEETQYGYTVENELHVQSFEYKGHRPSAHADRDYVIKCMVKKL